MRSGELARLAGVSTDTLRHYERMGLLALPQRTNGGYREYAPEALERVRLVRRALAIGFSLSDLREILKIRDGGGAPCHRVRQIAAAKLFQMDQQLADLTAMRKHLRRVLRGWDQRLARTPRGQRARLLEVLKKEPKRCAASHGFFSTAIRPSRKHHKEKQK